MSFGQRLKDIEAKRRALQVAKLKCKRNMARNNAPHVAESVEDLDAAEEAVEQLPLPGVFSVRVGVAKPDEELD